MRLCNRSLAVLFVGAGSYQSPTFVQEEFAEGFVGREAVDDAPACWSKRVSGSTCGTVLPSQAAVGVLSLDDLSDEESVARVAGDEAGVREGVLALAGRVLPASVCCTSSKRSA